MSSGGELDSGIKGAGSTLPAVAPSSPTDLAAMAERLVELREAFGMSQAQFARYCLVSPQALNNWEKGHNRPSYDMAYKIGSALGGVPPDYIMTGDTRGMPTEVMGMLQKLRSARHAG